MNKILTPRSNPETKVVFGDEVHTKGRWVSLDGSDALPLRDACIRCKVVWPCFEVMDKLVRGI